MTRSVVWSKSARADYLAILKYISDDNPGAAERVADRIDAAASLLAAFATGRVGRVAGTYEKLLPGLPYLLAYEILRPPVGGEVVAILRVIHGARDWQAESWPEGAPE